MAIFIEITPEINKILGIEPSTNVRIKNKSRRKVGGGEGNTRGGIGGIKIRGAAVLKD